MNEEFWRQFPPIPGFDCMEMKRRAQERIYEETKHMSVSELVDYFNRRAEERDRERLAEKSQQAKRAS